MNRRDFLKLGGVVSTALLVQFGPLGKMTDMPVEARAGNKLYRGTNDGKIYLSENDGKTWQKHMDFGPDISIIHMAADSRQNIHARLGIGGHTFKLTMDSDSNVWRTA